MFRNKAVVCKQMEEGILASRKEITELAGRAGPGDYKPEVLGSYPRKEKTLGLLSRPGYDGNAREDATCRAEGIT